MRKILMPSWSPRRVAAPALRAETQRTKSQGSVRHLPRRGRQRADGSSRLSRSSPASTTTISSIRCAATRAGRGRTRSWRAGAAADRRRRCEALAALLRRAAEHAARSSARTRSFVKTARPRGSGAPQALQVGLSVGRRARRAAPRQIDFSQAFEHDVQRVVPVAAVAPGCARTPRGSRAAGRSRAAPRSRGAGSCAGTGSPARARARSRGRGSGRGRRGRGGTPDGAASRRRATVSSPSSGARSRYFRQASKKKWRTWSREGLNIGMGSEPVRSCPVASLAVLPELAQVADQAARAVGLARLADVAPVQDQPVVRVLAVRARGRTSSSRSSTSSGFLPGAIPVRFATRKMCVSTAIVGLAERGVEDHVRGLAADARAAARAPRGVAGTSPPCRSTQQPARLDRRASPCCGRARSS